MSDQQLAGKVALITGSSRGIGRAIAIAFARAGADVIVTYKESSGRASEVIGEISSLGRKALLVKLDVASRTSVAEAFARGMGKFGNIDIVVNSAGVLQQIPFSDITDDDWERVLGVNLKGTFNCCQEAFRIMTKQKQGRIINIASIGGQIGGPLAVHYSASKAGVISLTRSLARIGAAYGIQVNCISPGLIETDMTRQEIESDGGQVKIKQLLIPRPGTADEVAEAALFLVSEKASYITGQTINVNGGAYFG